MTSSKKLSLIVYLSIIYFAYHWGCSDEDTVKQTPKKTSDKATSEEKSSSSSNNNIHLDYSAQPSSSVFLNETLTTQPEVSIYNASDQVVAQDNTDITLSIYLDNECSSKASGQLTIDQNPIATNNGVATFSGIKYNKAEVIYFKASSPNIISACSNAVNVKNTDGSSPSKLVYSESLSSTETAGSNFSISPKILVKNDNDQKITEGTYTVTITAYTDDQCSSDNNAPGTLVNTSGSTENGEITLSNLNYETAISIYLKASADGLTTACSGPIKVNPAAANKLKYKTQPSTSGTVDTTLSTQPVVRLLDTYNNLVTNSQINITLAASTASNCSTTKAGLSADTNPVTTDNGEASFAGVKHNTAETIRIKASATDITSACSNEITIEAAASFSVSVDSNLDNGDGKTNPTYAHTANCPSGSNRSPAVSWSTVPDGTQEFILIMDDLDGGPWLHWVIQFPSSTSSLAENIAKVQNPSTPSGSRQGPNDFGPSQIGWGGPSPPTPNHRYRFTLYALQSGFGSSWTISNIGNLESQLSSITYQKTETTIILSECP